MHYKINHLVLALQPWNKYEFSQNNPEVTHDNFVRKFYEWDAPYLKERTGGQVSIVKENKEKNYLIWNLQRPHKENAYFLFGLKGDVAHNFNIAGDNWDEAKKIDFLEQLFGD